MFKTAAAGVIATFLLMGSAQANEKVTVLLDWFVNPDHAPILVAEEIGAFKDADLDVEIVPPADPSLPPRLLAAKQADIAISYQPQLYLLADQGLPVVRVGTLIGSPLNTVLALAGGPIKALADLKGKKIGFSVSGIEEATLETMLKGQGVSLADVTMVNVNFALVTALMSGQVDGVIGGYRTFEADELKDHNVQPLVFIVEDFGIPAYDELILLANKDAVGEPKIKKFIEAVKKGTEYLEAHPNESWEAFIRKHPDLNNHVNEVAWTQTLPLFARDPGALDEARYAAYGKFLHDNKLTKAELPVSDYAIVLK